MSQPYFDLTHCDNKKQQHLLRENIAIPLCLQMSASDERQFIVEDVNVRNKLETWI